MTRAWHEEELDPLAEEALRLAKLPPPSDAELRARAGLAEETLRAWNRAARRRAMVRRVGGTLAVAAAAAALFLAPGAFQPVPRATQPEQAATADAGWQPPDPDELWDLSAVADPLGEEESVSPSAVAVAVFDEEQSL